MTESKKTPKANWKMTNAQPSRSKYTTFYLILLVLTTINAAFGVSSFGQIGNAFRHINDAPLLTCVTIGQHVATLFMIAGLVFLYKKQKEGLYLLFGAYAFIVIAMIILPFASESIIAETAKQISIQESARMSTQDAETIARVSLGIISAVSGISSMLFAFLWHLAWKKQVKRDTDTSI